MQPPSYSVSVVIPTYNGRSLLEKHLPAVLLACKKCEVIVVDDASTDDTGDWLTKNYPQIRLITLQTNLRFARACNIGVKKARGELILLLNNDVSPKHDFLSPLLSHFDDPNIFAVGCLEVNEKGEMSGRSEAHFERGTIRHFKAPDQSRSNTLWVSGGSGIFRKLLWVKLNGFDELFTPAYDEDRDLCYRALKRGYQVLFEPKSVVEHRHESTNQKVFNSLMLESAKHKNALLFLWKNISSKNYFRQHLLWLPYHILFTSIRTKGTYLVGLIWALFYVPKVYRLRRTEIRNTTVTDETLIPSPN